MMMLSHSSDANHSPVEQHQTFRKLTEMLQSCSENQCCADCTSRLMDSIWASTTVGAFLCIHCAGAHRKLGVQLSRVKSIHLDTWTDEEVAAMKGGNKSVNEVYNKHLDKWIEADASLELLPNTATDIREKCIRAKTGVLPEAPVPFVVGTHSDCLKHVAGRTTNVVFVDLDHNRVIPAMGESGKIIPVPKLPEREGAKLRAKLAEVAGIFDPYAAGINRVDQKLNRSLTIGKKKYDCSFLEDRSDEIQETFIAPPPSNIGLPDDGTIYKYKSFPRLKK
ncbi:hypothetical protein BBJ29_004101 [Phytophthora kernoviae]|uniref:Arf-GAP domain-containing protein n=1 Tax=Phytophthora kernoviae TaxID=325452 RepID=A0A3F2RK38_9STRA|nr:hypothetical protein BBJ29_004101 [Phytophthora kernoviae]RLN58781.1 hypothetical protein BBP00_00006816 [Phytophthora kernoviae]